MSNLKLRGKKLFDGDQMAAEIVGPDGFGCYGFALAGRTCEGFWFPYFKDCVSAAREAVRLFSGVC